MAESDTLDTHQQRSGGNPGVVAGVLGSTAGSMVSLGIWAGSLPVAAILLALRFKRDLKVAPVSSRVLRA